MTLHGGREQGMSRRNAGLIALAVLAVLVWFAFTKDIPFTHGYRVNAYFVNANNIKPKSPVRIAGVNIGKVAKVERDEGSSQTKLVLDLDKSALPIHSDATAKIRNRIFLEGNGFVEIKPGSPSSPEIKDGGSIPAAQTGAPVQLDQLLKAVNSDSRKGLQSIFQEIGTALDTPGTAAENETQDPEVKDLTGGEALNRALRYGPQGFRGGARVFDALVGDNSTDQQDILKGFRDFNSAINSKEAQLVPLIRDFGTTIGAFADDEAALAASTKQFSRLAIESEPTLRQLNLLLPQLTEWSNTIAPNLDTIPETTRLAYPWVYQTTQLLSQPELGKTAALAQPTIANLAKTQAESLKLFPELDDVAKCWNKVWYPTQIAKLADGSNSSGVENYKEFWYALVGYNSAAQNFNGNGSFLKLASGSAYDIKSPSGKLFGKTALQPNAGVNPALPSSNPPVRDDVACYKNNAPNMAPSPGSTPAP
jgi:phospholipid/cholesterol/gamma-HCH transport system substrate-binding protein